MYSKVKLHKLNPMTIYMYVNFVKEVVQYIYANCLLVTLETPGDPSLGPMHKTI